MLLSKETGRGLVFPWNLAFLHKWNTKKKWSAFVIFIFSLKTVCGMTDTNCQNAGLDQHKWALSVQDMHFFGSREEILRKQPPNKAFKC